MKNGISIKQIKKNNSEKFLEDVKLATSIMVFAPSTGVHLEVKKKDIKKEAQTERINYYMTDAIFVVRRQVMIIK